jgi:BirA family biotin operon repressor/biotin-[acetyl-CoA-carboxylase] ligase
MNRPMWLDAARFETLRVQAGATWGRPLRVLEQVESTNDLALAEVTGEAATGIVWAAKEQTRGRGRRGNPWVARPGDALLMSTLLRWPAPVQTAAGLGLAVGLAVTRACQMRIVGRRLGVKWPNDVVCEGSKLAGVLIECRSDGRGGVGIVLGVGINVGALDFEEAAGRATSLALLGAEPSGLSLEMLLVDVLAALELVVPRVLSGQLGPIIDEVRAVDALLGRKVQVTGASGDLLAGPENQSVFGLACGLSNSGELELETESGLVRITSGHVLFD